MRVYADSSFLLRLITGEPGADRAVAMYRSMGRPPLFYLPLHMLEVENAIRQRAFHERRVLPASQRAKIGRERDVVLSRLAQFVKRGALREVALDMDTAIEEARRLSMTHSERIGARAIDLLHVACAVLLQTESFLTFDQRQASLAETAGMRVYSLSDREA